MQEKFECGMQGLRENSLNSAKDRLKKREEFKGHFERANEFYREYLADIIDGRYDGQSIDCLSNMKRIFQEQLENARICNQEYEEFCYVNNCNEHHSGYLEFEKTVVTAIQTLDNKIQEKLGGSLN